MNGTAASRPSTASGTRFALSDLTDEQLAGFDAVFTPGGATGRWFDPGGQRRRDQGCWTVLHAKAAPIRGAVPRPGAACSRRRERADGQWLFDGYRMTCFTDEEEDQTEAGLLGMEWYLDTALEERRRRVRRTGRSGRGGVPHVVVDRNLITGQKPRFHRGHRRRGHQEAPHSLNKHSLKQAPPETSTAKRNGR